MSTEQRTRREAGITDDIQLITVRIEGQLIGLPITSVRDVFSISAMTPGRKPSINTSALAAWSFKL